MSLNLLHDITPGNNVPEELTVVIEINKGSLNKYELDKETGLIKLDRVSHTAQTFPFDYGFVPQTHWHDGDPLDVIVIATAPLIPGILVDVRPVAVMDMIDSGESDAKIIAVPTSDRRFDHVHSLEDINKHTLKEFTHFFETYKNLKSDDGKEKHPVVINGIEDKDKAMEAISKSIALYKEKFQK